jgi:carbonic anhydrase/acetyltransferase-like protein (isoleucine patch superfamily)
MRKVIIRKTHHIAPFNEPAHALRILNKSLWQWQRILLEPHCEQDVVIDSFEQVPQESVEMLVYSDNLWFDRAFLEAFMQEARARRRPVRAAFRADDPAFLQQGLRALTTSYEQRGDLYFVDLWYFPQGPANQIEPVVIPSNAREVGYYHIPTYMSDKNGDLVWWLPERACCAIDTWIHVFFANIVFGVFAQASRYEKRTANTGFKTRAMLRSLFERRPLLGSSLYVKTGKNCSIDPSAILQGPIVMGDNVTIGPGCVVTQCIIGDNVTLTHGNHFHMCILSDDCFFPWGASAYFTAFMENSSAAQNTSLEMSVVGRNTYIGGGTVFASFNLLPVPIHSMIDDRQVVDTETPVLGACIGHNCRLGSGLVVYPSRMIESDVVLIASPTRRVIMKDISYEESDHHALRGADMHPRMYPREGEEVPGGEQAESSW